MKTIRLATAVLLVFPATASAHPNHGASNFLDGFWHPFLGPDHLAAVVAVGLLAASLSARVQALPVAVFLVSSFLGGLAALAGTIVPGSDAMIVASVLLLGLLLALVRNAPPMLGVVLATALPLFGWFHGQAHVAEAGIASLGYVVGFLGGTATLHFVGYRAGAAASRYSLSWPLWAGTSVGAIGAFLLVAA